MKSSALVIGATGLVGRQLVNQLLAAPDYNRVTVFVRRKMDIQHPKLVERIIDFDKPELWRAEVTGDVLFSALGTTLKQAGSKEAQYQIDYTYQYQFAAAAAQNGVATYVLVSSAGADVKSGVFYSRMKGELELAVRQLGFKSLYLLQPSLLTGARMNARIGEAIGYQALTFLNAIGLFRKYKPIPGATVATAMINAAARAAPGVHTVTLDRVFDLART